MLTVKQVTISHDAQFGPDINDIRDWEALCIDFIDNKYQK